MFQFLVVLKFALLLHVNPPINLFYLNFQHVIENLSGNVEYVVKICAGTKSLSNPNKTWLGEPSEERVVYLPEDKCELGKVVTFF